MASRGEPSHLDLTVGDLATAIPFYAAVLGYLGYRPGGPGPDPVWLKRLASGPVWGIALREARATDGKADRNRPGLHHLAFHAASRGDVDLAHALLQEIGAEILDPPPRNIWVTLTGPATMRFSLPIPTD